MFVIVKYYILFAILCRLQGYSDGPSDCRLSKTTADNLVRQCRRPTLSARVFRPLVMCSTNYELLSQ